MFTPNEIEAMPSRLEKLYRDLQLNIMTDLAHRMKNMQDISSASDWQLNRLYELGMSKKEIQKFVKDTLNKSDNEIQRIFEDVIKSGYARDEELYKSAGKDFISYEENRPLQQLVNSMKKQTGSECKNITQSLGFAVKQPDGKLKFQPIADYYQDVLDRAAIDITSGAFDYTTVLNRTVSEMTNSGLRTVDYASGWSNRVEVAARRAVLSGFNQVVAKINEDNAKKLGTDTYEVSWHSGHRPSHWWGGKWFTHAKLVSVCGLGAVDGLCGANCYHSYSPVIPGISKPTYTAEQLEALESEEQKKRRYGDKEYTKYEALQKQRRLESTMRAQRQKVKLLEEGNADEDAILAAKAKYFKTSDEYVKFSEAMDLPQQRERVNIDGLGAIKGEISIEKFSKSDIIEVANSITSNTRFPATQEKIDSLIAQDLNGVNFTCKPKYNSRIRDNGKTTIREYGDGTVKEIVKVEIGKQDKSSAEFLEDTILHEELEARIAIRSIYSGKYKELYNAPDYVRHQYINRIIKRYFKIKGWNYELV